MRIERFFKVVIKVNLKRENCTAYMWRCFYLGKLQNVQVRIVRLHLQTIRGKGFDRCGEVEKSLKFRVHLYVLNLGKYLHIVC